MTRRQDFDIWVAPGVAQAIRSMAERPGISTDDVRSIWAAERRLAISGTRASGAKKLSSLDLWAIRAGRYRLLFCPVPGGRRIAVGALVLKTSKKLRATKLKSIEREVHHWRDEVEGTR